MSKSKESSNNIKKQREAKEAIALASQDFKNNQSLGANWVPSFNDFKSLLNPVKNAVAVLDGEVRKVKTEMTELTKTFKPDIPQILKIDEIKDLISFSKQSFNPQTLFTTLNNLSGTQNQLMSAKDSPLTGLFSEVSTLNKNLDAVLSEYTPPFFNALLNETNRAADNAVKIIAQLEPVLDGKYGIKVPDTFDIAVVTETLNDLNSQLSNIDITKLDDNIQEVWKPIKIGLMCVLDISMAILKLLGDVAPLNISLGAAGGVAAGVNATGKASADVISLGKLSWGTISTVVGILKTLINSGDSYIDLRIAQRRSSAA